jgi:uncharacterized membrane protein HdeD (DUF308 family)
LTARGIAKESINWSIGLAVVMVVVGLLALIAPLAAGLIGSVFVGWLITLYGALHLWFAWHTRGTGAFLWEMLISIAFIVVGLFMAFHPLAGLITLTLLLAVYLLVKGLIELMAGFSTRGVPGSGWVALNGIVSLLLAGLIWFHLFSSAVWVLGTLIGISILFSGLSRLFFALAARRALVALP